MKRWIKLDLEREMNVIKAFFWSRQWAWYAYGGSAFLILSLYAQVRMSVAINTWYGGFYNLLQKAVGFKLNPDVGIAEFYEKMFSFGFIFGTSDAPSFSEIAFPYVLLATITAYFTRRYGLWWREAITFNYIGKWRHVENEIEGASQRIQEDGSTVEPEAPREAPSGCPYGLRLNVYALPDPHVDVGEGAHHQHVG